MLLMWETVLGMEYGRQHSNVQNVFHANQDISIKIYVMEHPSMTSVQYALHASLESISPAIGILP